MCLTEEQCGTDLGLIKTLATPINDNYYSIKGQKIYITSGDQDLTENVIHLVLAKTPNAPEGTKGLSLFLVPKIKVNNDGSLADRNNVRASHVFDKMGIRGVPTCAIEFDDAEGFLIGNLNEGLKSMFVMMNIEDSFFFLFRKNNYGMFFLIAASIASALAPLTTSTFSPPTK